MKLKNVLKTKIKSVPAKDLKSGMYLHWATPRDSGLIHKVQSIKATGQDLIEFIRVDMVGRATPIFLDPSSDAWITRLND